MADEARVVRVLTVTISDLRKRFADEAGKRLDAELTAAGLTVVRHAVLADEPTFIRELVRSVATGNGPMPSCSRVGRASRHAI